MPEADSYTRLVEELRQIQLMKSCANVLSWDEQTYLPSKGAELRANQLSLLAGLAHQRATSDELGDLLDVAADRLNGDPRQAACLREARRDYERERKLPRRLVEELSRVITLSQQAWIAARRNKDFAAFQPWLEQVVALKREEASATAPETGVLYDALLDNYETGATAAEISSAFAPLREALVPLVQSIADSPVEPPVEILTRQFPVDRQREFGRMAAAAIGFDFEAGRLDESAHPFCGGIGPGDCRLTTRYDERHFPGAFFGTLHEAGHGMYEQGLPAEDYGSPLGESVSLGIHESQSRMWENFVGRSRSFWQHFYPEAQAAFPEALEDISLDRFYAAVNDVRPSFIRVEADEATYNLHIMLRFELEQPLLTGDLPPADVPAAWNEVFKRDFGLLPEDVSRGCLQDVHWSAGLIGYFPTYALGNMYAAQFFETAQQELGDLDEQFARGEFAPLLGWLRTNIHQRGRELTPTDLLQAVTGQTLSHEPLMRHLHGKLDRLYRLS